MAGFRGRGEVVVEEHWPTFLERAEQSGGLPDFIVEEFEAYLRCGMLEHGLAHFACRLFVFENLSGDIVAFDLDGVELGRMSTPAMALMGITIGPDGTSANPTAYQHSQPRTDCHP